MNIIKQFMEENQIHLESISLYKMQSKLEFVVQCNKIISQKLLSELEDECLERNPMLKKVSIVMEYIGEEDPADRVKSYLPSIEYVLSKYCPASSNIESCFLIDCSFIDENQLVINVQDNVVKESLSKKKMDQQIRNLIAMNLGLDIQVRLVGAEKPFDSKKYFEDADRQLERMISTLEKTEPKATKKVDLSEDILKGRKITGDAIPLGELEDGNRNVIVGGEVFATEIRKLNNKKLLQSFVIHDGTGSMMCKAFWDDESDMIRNGSYIKI